MDRSIFWISCSKLSEWFKILGTKLLWFEFGLRHDILVSQISSQINPWERWVSPGQPDEAIGACHQAPLGLFLFTGATI